MALFNRCMDCKFAAWNRTQAGRLHPNGTGRCTWTKAIALPAAISADDQARILRLINGSRWIERKAHLARCDTFVRADLQQES